MGLPKFTCEIIEADDPVDVGWRKFSFQDADSRRRFMARAVEQGGRARLATLDRKDLPPVLQAMFPVVQE